MNILKRLKCNHEYETISNYYGDYINYVSLRHIYRRSAKCKNCGKIKYFSDLDYTCKIINDGTYKYK